MSRHSAVYLSFAVAALVALGLVMLASTSVWTDITAGPYDMVIRHSIFIGLGLFAAVVASLMDYRWLRRWWKPLLLVSCVLLAACYVPGLGITVKGETRWLPLPGVGRFQPSEPAKLVTMIAVAAWLASHQAVIKSFWKGFVGTGALLGIPVALIFFETDMGTAASLAAAGLCVLFLAGVRWPYLLMTVLMGGSAFAFFVRTNENRWNRIIAFMNLDDPEVRRGFGMQQFRALEAFAHGGLGGVGLGNGAEKHGYLPEAHNDFIFPVIGEELGLWFTLGTVLCYVLITVFGMVVAMNASDTFGRLLAAGITAVIVVPAMLNIAVTTATLPNKGLPLPFVSFGGTNLVFALASIGLLISIHRRGNYATASEALPIGENSYALRL